jgi:hypothetical protein
MHAGLDAQQRRVTPSLAVYQPPARSYQRINAFIFLTPRECTIVVQSERETAPKQPPRPRQHVKQRPSGQKPLLYSVAEDLGLPQQALHGLWSRLSSQSQLD